MHTPARIRNLDTSVQESRVELEQNREERERVIRTEPAHRTNPESRRLRPQPAKRKPKRQKYRSEPNIKGGWDG